MSQIKYLRFLLPFLHTLVMQDLSLDFNIVRRLLYNNKSNLKDDNMRNSQIVEGENCLAKTDVGLN